MDLELAGKSVLITGASRGIGRAAAKTFAAPVQTQADINAQAQAAISGLHRQAVPLLLQFITAKFATDPLFPAALGTINGHLAAQKAKIK